MSKIPLYFFSLFFSFFSLFFFSFPLLSLLIRSASLSPYPIRSVLSPLPLSLSLPAGAAPSPPPASGRPLPSPPLPWQRAWRRWRRWRCWWWRGGRGGGDLPPCLQGRRPHLSRTRWCLVTLCPEPAPPHARSPRSALHRRRRGPSCPAAPPRCCAPLPSGKMFVILVKG